MHAGMQHVRSRPSSFVVLLYIRLFVLVVKLPRTHGEGVLAGQAGDRARDLRRVRADELRAG